jgi:hypothetical protein
MLQLELLVSQLNQRETVAFSYDSSNEDSVGTSLDSQHGRAHLTKRFAGGTKLVDGTARRGGKQQPRASCIQ